MAKDQIVLEDDDLLEVALAREADEEAAAPKRDAFEGAPTPKPRRSLPSGLRRRGGRREMKEYPLTQGELWGLGGLSIAATLFFSISSFCFSNAFNLYKDMAFTPQLKPSIEGFWHGIMVGSFWGGFVFGVFGLVFLTIDGIALHSIIRETTHGD